MYPILKIWNPDLFQGKYKSKKYFEGWYFKLIDKNQESILSIIPGISFTNADTHAFIQIINGKTNQTYYFRYSIDDFKYSNKFFDIYIGNNHFTREQISIDINAQGLILKGELHFDNRVSYPKSIASPGIMGYYHFIPFMECYHSIVNIHHQIRGSLTYNHTTLDFTEGYGYIEKDWGRSFPESWIWIQSNHFIEGNVCLMFSIARIPWFHKSFTGFISFIRIGNKQYTFASYTSAKIKQLWLCGSQLSVRMEDKNYILSLKVNLSQKSGILVAPKMGSMVRKIKESINSTVEVCLSNSCGKVIYQGLGFHTGTEIAGNANEFDLSSC